MDRIIITAEPISVAGLERELADHPCCGAAVTFAGRVRNHNAGRTVAGIVYECYEEMARKELAAIVDEAREKWEIHQVLVAHRVGNVNVGEVSLVVIATAPHREKIFSAVQAIVTELKRRVPIWKHEQYGDISHEL